MPPIPDLSSFRLSSDLARQLYQDGCGAFVGRSGCAEPVVGFLQGSADLPGVVLWAQSYEGAWLGNPDVGLERAILPGIEHPDADYIVLLCTRHAPQSGHSSPIEAQQRLMQDCAPEVQAYQLVALKAFLASYGRRLELR